MAGYTRNDTPNNIADGNVINASDLDGEFDAIENAFNGTAGHSHDGSSGAGPQIAAGGIASNAVTTAKILDANVTTAKIADNNVTTAKILDANVTTAKIAADAIDGTKIADDVIDSEHYVAGSIDGEHLADDVIDSEHYVAGSIDAEHLASNSVTSAKLDTNIQVAGTLGVTGETTLTTHLNMGDNDIIKLGDSADLQIYHDGTNSFIKDNGTGGIFMRATSNIKMESTDGNRVLAEFTDSAGSDLYYNNGKKLATTATGIQVTGNIANTSGDLTLDVASDLNIDVDDGRVFLKDGGTTFGRLANASTDFEIVSVVQDKDILFKGSDGGSEITALTLDMSDAGTAIFNHDIKLSADAIIDCGGNLRLDAESANIVFQDTGTAYGKVFQSSSDFVIKSETSNKDIIFQGFDGGSTVTALTLDMSDAGTAIFNHDINLPDDGKLQLGASQDLQIYHNGSHSYIDDTGTGDLYIRANDQLRLQKYTGENMIVCNVDGAIQLYNDNIEKLATTSTGIQVTGTALATTDTDTTNTGNVSLDFTANQNFVLTLTGSVFLTNPPTQAGQSGFITFIQDGNGSRSVSLGTSYKTAGGAALALSSTPNAVDVVPYIIYAAGLILLGTPQLAFS